MPVYEYRCAGCRRRSSVFVRTFSSEPMAVCEHCGKGNMTRVLSQFAFRRGGGSMMDTGDDSGFEGLDEDPRAMARMMRQMSDEMGEEIDPETNEMLGLMESGALPDDLEGAMGDDFGDES